MPLSPKWQIIHAHSLNGRLSTLVCPKIHAHSGRPGASPLPSQSVTARGPFRSYLLQIETFTNQPNHLSKSVTVRTVFLSYLLQIKTFIGRTGPLSHSVTARHSFPQLLQVENVHCVPINPSFDITRQPCRHRQIHAPAWGTTSEDDLRLLVSKFQSARPHGARQAKHNVELFRSEFQFARPLGARPASCGWRARCCRFNPRARVGRDHRPGTSGRVRSCFNPRARVGRDPKPEPVFAVVVVLIHAPAWGATSFCD